MCGGLDVRLGGNGKRILKVKTTKRSFSACSKCNELIILIERRVLSVVYDCNPSHTPCASRILADLL